MKTKIGRVVRIIIDPLIALIPILFIVLVWLDDIELSGKIIITICCVAAYYLMFSKIGEI